MFQEYPKAIFQDGKPDAECRVALTAEAEKELAALGFVPIGEAPEQDAPKRRGRPPKQ